MAFTKSRIPKTREEWLQERLKGIGGSDAGTIMGVNKWKSPYALWAEKTGRITQPDQASEVMIQGTDCEPVVADRFCREEEKRVKKSNYSFQSVEFPFMRANVDRLVIGEKAGLECKTASMTQGSEYKKGIIPLQYYYQCLHYMAVLGLERMYLAVMVYSTAFETFVIDRSDTRVQADIEELIQKEKEFWQMVTDDVEPEPDGSESTQHTLAELYGIKALDLLNDDTNQPDDLTELNGIFEKIEDINFEIKAVNSRLKELKTSKTDCENQIARKLKSSKRGICGSWKAEWADTSRGSVNTEKLQAEFPEAYEQCFQRTVKPKIKIRKMKAGKQNGATSSN